MGTTPSTDQHQDRRAQDQASETVIRTQHLSKRYGAAWVVDQLDLEVRRGDIFGFLGPNGAGKTTTIRMLTGLVQPTAGEVLLFGAPLKRQRAALLPRVGALLESPALYPYLSGAENLRVVAAASGMPQDRATERRIAQVLDVVGLAAQPRMPFRRYSQGMRQRLGIAAALLAEPELLILDEPTNGLDPAGVAEFRALLTQLAEQGKTVFLSSHDLPEVQVLCHRVAILAKGRLLYQGTVSDLLHKQIGQRVRLQIGFESPGMLQAALALLQAQQQGEAAEWLFEVQHGAATPQGQLQVEVKTGYASAVNALLAQHQLFASELHRIETTLEQYFLSLTAASAESGRAPGQSPSPASVFVSARAAQPSRLTSTS